jgi:hypothetical protein
LLRQGARDIADERVCSDSFLQRSSEKPCFERF